MASNHPIVDIRSPSVDQENSKGMKEENIEETKREEYSSDDEEGLGRSLTARRFNRSMRNVVKISKCYKAQVSLRGVIKAKNCFLKFINRLPAKIIITSDKRENEIDIKAETSLVDSEWKRLSEKPPIFKMFKDIDFSDLAVYIIKENTVNVENVNISAPLGPSHPPPPPPPPPAAPSTASPRLAGDPQSGRKIKPIHVKQVHVKHNQETIWTTLPVLEADLRDLQKLFEETSSSNSGASDFQKLMRLDSISRPLSTTEALDVQIMFRMFPKYVYREGFQNPNQGISLMCRKPSPNH